MKHLKKFPINNKSQKLSKDMKKQDLVKPKKDKQLDAEKSLSEKPRFSKRFSKPSNKKLSSEKFLSGKKAIKVKEEPLDIGVKAEIEEKYSASEEFANKTSIAFLNEETTTSTEDTPTTSNSQSNKRQKKNKNKLDYSK